MRKGENVRTVATPTAVWILAVGLAVWIVIGVWPPHRQSPLPASASANVFSAGRAMRYVRAIAQRPHPVGSADHDRVRDYILGQFKELSLDPAVQSGVGTFHRKSGHVENIVARLHGDSNTRPVMLASHYDSVSRGPGAGDDAHGVAVLLETLRAVKNGPPLRNDIIFLVTDGEEIDLLGAALFMAEHSWREDPGVVLNFEARGTGGPPSMFETSKGNAWLIRNLQAAAPRANATSLAYEVYKHMPNDTDLTVFKQGGLAGMNFAFIDHPEVYHSAQDDPPHLDQRSLQEQGDYALALVRRFGNEDLNQRHTGDAIYFPTRFTSLIVYPSGWVAPTAWATVALLIAVTLVGWHLRAGDQWIALLLAVPSALLLLAAWAAPGTSYVLEWPLLGAVLAYAVFITAPVRIGFGLGLIALLVLAAPVFLLLVPMLEPLQVALGYRAIGPLLALVFLILVFLSPQLALLLRAAGEGKAGHE